MKFQKDGSINIILNFLFQSRQTYVTSENRDLTNVNFDLTLSNLTYSMIY